MILTPGCSLISSVKCRHQGLGQATNKSQGNGKLSNEGKRKTVFNLLLKEIKTSTVFIWWSFYLEENITAQLHVFCSTIHSTEEKGKQNRKQQRRPYSLQIWGKLENWASLGVFENVAFLTFWPRTIFGAVHHNHSLSFSRPPLSMTAASTVLFSPPPPTQQSLFRKIRNSQYHVSK